MPPSVLSRAACGRAGRWVLKPGVASISTMCLDVVGSEMRPLLEQALARGLTTHESTLLEGVKKAVEQLLEVGRGGGWGWGDGAAGQRPGLAWCDDAVGALPLPLPDVTN